MNTRRFIYEFTLAGWVFLGVSLFVLLAAINSGNNPLFFAFGLMSGALFVSAAIGSMMLRRIEVHRLLADHVAAGVPLEVHYRLRNTKRRWPSFALHVGEARFRGELAETPDAYCLHLPAGQSATAMTRLLAPRRGLVDLTDIRISCAFPFGFVRRTAHFPRPQRIVVFPRIGRLSRDLALRFRNVVEISSFTSETRGGQEEFYGVREYRAGDSTRAIHWRRSARTGELVIREMTTNAPPTLIVVLNVRSWRAHPGGREHALTEAERAIEVAAAAICYGFRENYAVGLAIAGTDDTRIIAPRPGREQRSLLLEALAVVDVESLRESPGPPPEVRGWGRAGWLVVTLAKSDTIDDLTPAATGRTVLALDDPASPSWVTFADDVPEPEENDAGVLAQEQKPHE